jgi:hypothetical protein
VDGTDVDEQTGEPAPIGRSLALAAGVGAAIGLAVIGVVYAIVAIPVYALAQSDPHGLDRPLFRTALFHIAVPAGLGIGLVVGALVGVWYARGGHLPDDRNPYE